MRKKLLSFIATGLIISQLRAQPVYELAGKSPGRIRYGLDMVKSLISVINLNNYPIQSQRFLSIDPILGIQRTKPNRFWLAQAGVTYIDGMPFNATRLHMMGGSLKFGSEWKSRPDLGFALLATSSVWQTGGVVQTAATAFGPYAGAVATVHAMALGAECQWNIDWNVGTKWTARLNLRANLFWKSNVDKAVETPYIPGTGLYIDSLNLSPFGPPPPSYHPVGFTVGATIQVFYTPNRTNQYRPDGP
jgi:hypothetical protein